MTKKCRIVGQLLVDHALSYTLTDTADVSDVYIHQFWKTVRQVPNANETICFMVDKQEITYTVDMFHATLKLQVETHEQPFIPLANFEYIQLFLRIVGYQVLTNVRASPNSSLIIMEKYESIPKRLKEDYQTIKDDTPLVNVYTTGEVIVQGMLIPNDLLTDAIRDTQVYKDYEAKYGGVEVPMIQPEPVESTQGTHRTPKVTRTHNPEVVQKKRKGKQVVGESSSPESSLKIRNTQKKSIPTTILPLSDDRECDEIIKASQLSLALDKIAKIINREDDLDGSNFADILLLIDEDFDDRLEPGSHKKNLEKVDDVDEKKDNKKDDDDDNNDNDDHTDHTLIRTQRTGSSKIKTEKMQTPISTPLRCPRIDLYLDKDINQELTFSVIPTPSAPSKDQPGFTSSKHTNLAGIIAKMSKR
ncbi:hypothetical protein Tco_0938747 [Tanacetum coccineum]|uniref:Uncharacterized protein n=1 Tax=Tanacetum coccineum TaxID=301880 RepID=A0ABQ5DKK6_9ASTR